jgi:3,4-dihydroxy 2-butanone 4-phosphate synthase/GTP cyclohydrolase II
VIVDPMEALAGRRASHSPPTGRPFVTVAYAQSLDGSIAAADGRPLPLSGAASMVQTHRLRAAHDGILVGIGTILADDPRLTVRLVDGPQPQPVLVDTHLRTPASALVFEHPHRPWIAAAEPFPPGPQAALQSAGAQLLTVPRQSDGLLDLRELLRLILERGLASVLVEGGSRILRGFLSARLVDWIVVTIAPRFVAGHPALAATADGALPALHQPQWASFGDDILVWGEPAWPSA